jgi:hypothetical protein
MGLLKPSGGFEAAGRRLLRQFVVSQYALVTKNCEPEDIRHEAVLLGPFW